ncbi:autotransporter outer membrane beta-barrel domain-containing protein [Denitrobaculum tricleocarpae]|uniref:Autotransporter outer membrane beta-barrel domain-containing protein n=2 Tax=Denitrobaculum tricleocarpae TaxID=2591009 RepID=A0A545TRZ3_9PROT|nr:autotransporter outer membrane beta-barrel domain-containing protein [Denitrobaculum tricleocarpae]
MTVNGNLILRNGSVLEIEFDAAGNADKIVVAGTATLDGTLRMLPQVGAYTKNHRYLVIDAGAVTGSFSAADIAQSTRLAGVQVQVTITADQVFMELTGASIGQIADDWPSGPVADYIEPLRRDARGDRAKALSALELLPIGELNDALNALSPQTVDAIPEMKGAYHRLMTGLMEARLRRLRAAPDVVNRSSGSAPLPSRWDSLPDQTNWNWQPPKSLKDEVLAVAHLSEESASLFEYDGLPYTFWTQLIGETGQKETESRFLGYDYQIYGLATGVDRRLSQEWEVGAVLALGRSEAEFDRDRGTTDGETLAGGMFVGWTPEPDVALDLSLWGDATHLEMQRNIAFTGIDRQADADVDVRSLGIKLRGELRQQLSDHSYAGYGGLGYVSSWQESYCETGAGSLNLCVEDAMTGEFFGELGVKIAHDVVFPESRLTLDADFALVANLPTDDRAIRSGFAGDGTFEIAGDDDFDAGISPSFGASYQADDQLSISARYEGHFEEDLTVHGVQLGLQYRF